MRVPVLRLNNSRGLIQSAQAGILITVLTIAYYLLYVPVIKFQGGSFSQQKV